MFRIAIIQSVSLVFLAVFFSSRFIPAVLAENDQQELNEDVFKDVYNGEVKLQRDSIDLCFRKHFVECFNVMLDDIATSRCYGGDKFVAVSTLRRISSIHLHGCCLKIYDRIGCTGKAKTLVNSDPCQFALGTCGWKGEIKSFSLCNYTIPPTSFNAISLSGHSCKTECTSLKENWFFQCDTDYAWEELCFPSPQQHFLGHYCNELCTVPGFWATKNVVLYDNINFEGHGEELTFTNSSNNSCENIPLRYIGILASMHAKQNCVRFYTSRDCIGSWIEFRREVIPIMYFRHKSARLCNNETILHDCNNNNCGIEHKNDNLLPVVFELKTRKSVIIKNNTCINLLEKFPAVYWVQLDIHKMCVRAFTAIGCTGESESWFESYNFKHQQYVSMMICDGILPRLYAEPKSSTGKQCLSSCSTDPSKNIYFNCTIGSNNAWDFCSPRKGMDPFGIACEANCTFNNRTHMVTTYEFSNFTGKAFQVVHLENKTCHNFKGNDSWVLESGIGSVNSNGYCIYLYTNIGCTGENKTYIEKYNNVHENLGKYFTTTKFKSLRFCTDGLPEVSAKQCGASGATCINECLPRNESYFNCATNNVFTEPCYPRNGFDSFGETTCRECECGVENNPIRIILFQYTSFSGKRVNIRKDDLQPCYNLVYDLESNHSFNKVLSSLKLVGVDCIRIYKSMGCNGLNATIFEDLPNADSNCNFTNCMTIWRSFIKSFSYCDIMLPPVLETPVTYSGNSCEDECEETHQVFECTTDVGILDFCVLRSNQNHFGQSCGSDNCIFKKPSKSVVLSVNKTQTVTIEFKNNECYDFGLQTNRSFLIVRESIQANSACVIVYDGIGCSGNSTTIAANSKIQCQKNETCFMLNISSFNFCGTLLPEMYQLPVGHSGKLCKSACAVTLQNQFCCQLHDGSFEACSPRPGQDYRGEFHWINSTSYDIEFTITEAATFEMEELLKQVKKLK